MGACGTQSFLPGPHGGPGLMHIQRGVPLPAGVGHSVQARKDAMGARRVRGGVLVLPLLQQLVQVLQPILPHPVGGGWDTQGVRPCGGCPQSRKASRASYHWGEGGGMKLVSRAGETPVKVPGSRSSISVSSGSGDLFSRKGRWILGRAALSRGASLWCPPTLWGPGPDPGQILGCCLVYGGWGAEQPPHPQDPSPYRVSSVLPKVSGQEGGLDTVVMVTDTICEGLWGTGVHIEGGWGDPDPKAGPTGGAVVLTCGSGGVSSPCGSSMSGGCWGPSPGGCKQGQC